MIGLGTIVNSAVIITGGTAGVLAKSGLPERYRETVMQALGLSVLIIGLSGCLQGIFMINSAGELDRRFVMLMIFSLVIGGLLGEFMNIEQKLERTGQWIQSRIGSAGKSFSEGFVSASLLYCVGAMAIVGSITLLAGLIKPWLTNTVILQTSLVGSVLILAIGFNILEIKRIKAGNLLPAIFIPLIYYIIHGIVR